MGYGPYKIRCTMWRDGDKVILDFDGTDPQSPAPINFFLNENMFKMFFGIYMIMVFDPQILFNDGFYDLIDVRIPEGSLLKPQLPGRAVGPHPRLGRIFDILGGLLGQGNPELLNAAGFSSSPHLFYSGYDGDGERRATGSSCSQIGFGGIPGRPAGRRAGRAFTVAGLHQCAQRIPRGVLPAADRDAMRPSPTPAAPALHRGGNGIHMAYRFLEDGEIAIHDDRWLTCPWGVNGGEPGERGRKGLERADGTDASPRATRSTTWRCAPATCCTSSPGAAAAGATRWRAIRSWSASRCAVAWSARTGARRYGVVLRRGRRGRRRRHRSLPVGDERRGRPDPLPTFNMGPPLESIIARALEETGLPAPRAPISADDAS